MNNNLVIVSNYSKRLRNFGYGFHTCIPNTLMNLYDINQDEIRAYHHIFKYNEDIALFNYPILITKELVTFINLYIKEVEDLRKKEKKKPKEVQILYAIREHSTYIDFLPYVEGLEFPSRYMKINLINKESIFYKNQIEIFERINIIRPNKRHIVEYSVDDYLFDYLKDAEDVSYIELEIDKKVIKYPLASSIYFSLRKSPNNMTMEIANTKNESIFMITISYDTDMYSERHISFALYG